MKFLILIYGAVRDLIIRYLPNFNKDKNYFAFKTLTTQWGGGASLKTEKIL